VQIYFLDFLLFPYLQYFRARTYIRRGKTAIANFASLQKSKSAKRGGGGEGLGISRDSGKCSALLSLHTWSLVDFSLLKNDVFTACVGILSVPCKMYEYSIWLLFRVGL
jgi:hypothetical protein